VIKVDSSTATATNFLTTKRLITKNDQSSIFLVDTQYLMGNFRYLLPKSEDIGGWKNDRE